MPNSSQHPARGIPQRKQQPTREMPKRKQLPTRRNLGQNRRTGQPMAPQRPARLTGRNGPLNEAMSLQGGQRGKRMKMATMAKATPTAFTELILSLNTPAPTRVPSAMTPMFIAEKTSVGLSENT